MTVVLDRVSVRYEDGPKALRDVSIVLNRGVNLITGPNGSGKTTLLRLLSGLIPFFYKAEVEGGVWVDKYNPLEDPEKLIGYVGYMMADPEIQVTGFTGWDEAAMAPSFLGLPKDEVIGRALDALEKAEAMHLADKTTATMSSGELQRVGLAGVFSLKPRVLLMDEPLAYVDEEAVERILRVLRRLCEEMTIIVATHDTKIFAPYASRIVFLEEGRTAYTMETPSPEEAVEKTHKPSSNTVLKISNIYYRYPRAKEYVIENLDLKLRMGEVKALVGPNGSGKTTLLKIAAGLLKPSKGVVSRKGAPAYLPSNPLLVFDKATLREELSGLDGGAIAETLGVKHLFNRPLLTLSTGELKKAALATVLSRGRDILLLDEPTAGLALQEAC